MSAGQNRSTGANPITGHFDLWSSATKKKATVGRGSNRKISPHGINKLRELILQLAVRGKLVPQDPNDEPASVLLEKIAIEKQQLIKEKKIKKQKALAPISAGDKLFELPDSWEWENFGSLAQHNAGKTLDKGRNKGELREYLTTSNLYWGRFNLSEVRKMPIQDSELEKCQATNGDLLICEGGEAGRAAVWEQDYGICFQNHVHRARFYGGINSYYACRLMEKLDFTGEINQFRKGVAISNMSGKALASIPFPLPPLMEQHRIVAKVDELMALCDQLDQQQTNSLQAHQTLVRVFLDRLVAGANTNQPFHAEFIEAFDTLFTTEEAIDQLKQTILQLAVMGKLVPQNPNDEPASVLLEKIASEKEQLIKDKKIKKQKPLPLISDKEKPFELPAGWEWSRLQNTIDVRDGTHDSPRDASGQNLYPLVTSKNFVNGEIDFESARMISEEDHLEISKRSLVEVDDILFSMIGGNIGNQVIVKDSRPFSVKNVALFKYYSRAATLPSYFKLYTEELAIELQQNASGGAQPFVSLGVLRKLVFALPPKEEQHRIVAKVDELMALCDTLKARLQQAQTTQAQLADAVVERAVG